MLRTLTMRSSCRVSVVAAALVLASAGPAGACLSIDLGLNGSLPPVGPTPAAGPGDTVRFTISGTEKGAEYVLRIEGREVASGRDGDGGGLASSFTMPDLGVEQTVLVEPTVTHEGESWPLNAKPLVFKPPAGTSDPAPPTQKPEASGPAKPPKKKAAEPATPSNAPVATPSASPRTASKPAVARPSQVPRPEPRRFLSLVDAHPVESASAVSVQAAPIARRDAPAPREIPWYPLALALLGFLMVGGGAAGLAFARRRRPDGPSSDPIEAELQEMIAEERAKQTLTRTP